jgi:signal transduction histidine kinase
LRPSVRTYLLALQAATVIPLAALFAYSLYRSGQKDMAAARASVMSVAQVAKSSVQQFLAEAESVLTEISGWSAVRDAAQGRCRAFSKDFPHLYPRFARVVIAGADGRLLCDPRSAAPGAGDPRSESLRRAIQAERFTVGRPHLDPDAKRWVVVLAYPVRDEERRAVGAVGLAVDLIKYRVDLQRISTQPGSVIGLVDGDGQYLTRTLDAEAWVGRNGHGVDIVEAALEGTEGELVASGVDGVERIYAFTTIPGLMWKVYSGIPVREAMAPLRAEALRSGILGAVCVAAAVGLSSWLARSIVVPILTLTTTTRRVARGSLEARAAVEGPAEIAEVATALNDMITARVRAEEELRRQEVMSALGSLLAGVAHEVRNPLFGISATLDAFEARFAGSSEHQPYLEVLRTEAHRLTRLMADLLEYGRSQDLDLAEQRFEPVAREAVLTCRPLAENLGVTLETSIHEPLGSVRIDHAKMVQALRNVIDIAVRHSPRGSTVRVTVRSRSEDGHRAVEMEVRDAGPGFAAEDLDRLFQPFFTRRPGGTGLGLSIVKRIVEGHDGQVLASNRREGGAVVIVRLPEVERSVAAAPDARV